VKANDDLDDLLNDISSDAQNFGDTGSTNKAGPGFKYEVPLDPDV
jgi:hypothetical protein